MQNIEDEIGATKLARAASQAIEAFTDADRLVKAAEDRLSYAEANVDRDPHGSFGNARDVFADRDEIEDDLQISEDELSVLTQAGRLVT